jgi:hypothetical protein
MNYEFYCSLINSIQVETGTSVVAPIELWGLVDANHPELSKYVHELKQKDSSFRPGWITDSVSTVLQYTISLQMYKDILILIII